MSEGRPDRPPWNRYLSARRLVPVCPWHHKNYDPPPLQAGEDWISRICPECAAKLARDLAKLAVESRLEESGVA